ncbi:MAG: histidinol-phosphatase HisJ family protein [Lachnospiraceae bacterium]|nr:histidinol-phosphatase HisJ family protein [Lachnospiraceae bacterium]
MTIRADYHMHTDHSGDSKASMESMIEHAIESGLSDICFTEHHDIDFIYNEAGTEGMFELDIPKYRADYLRIVPGYADRINVRFGMELGVQPDIASKLQAAVDSAPFDFIIASSHLCHKKDPYYASFCEGRTIKEAMTEYFESILENIRAFDDFDVYGHLDYAIRYAPVSEQNFLYKYADYADVLDEIFRSLIEKGKGLEINTGGLRRNMKATNPNEEILKRYRELGGEIITTASDAHEPAMIASAFDLVEAILSRCGFRYYTIFRDRKPSFLPL